MSAPACRYEANFTKGSLLVPESRVVSGLLLRGCSAAEWHQAIVVENRLQKRALNTATTHANLVRSRLRTMGPDLWRLVSTGPKPVATHAVLTTTVKFSPLFGDFLDLVVREQVRQFKDRLRPALWDAYMEACYDLCPGMAGWAQSTRSKLRQNAIRMLAEAGYLADTRSLRLQAVDLSPEVLHYLNDHKEEYVLRCIRVSQ